MSGQNNNIVEMTLKNQAEKEPAKKTEKSSKKIPAIQAFVEVIERPDGASESKTDVKVNGTSEMILHAMLGILQSLSEKCPEVVAMLCEAIGGGHESRKTGSSKEM